MSPGPRLASGCGVPSQARPAALHCCVFPGWLEGVRLADGEKGWVPQAHVEEISSLSARLRNLREYKRVSNASSKLEDQRA